MPSVRAATYEEVLERMARLLAVAPADVTAALDAVAEHCPEPEAGYARTALRSLRRTRALTALRLTHARRALADVELIAPPS
jgi:hypothetical protein